MTKNIQNFQPDKNQLKIINEKILIEYISIEYNDQNYFEKNIGHRSRT